MARACHLPRRGHVRLARTGPKLGGHLEEHRANRVRWRLAQTRVLLHEFAPYAERVWELRENLTVYDAWYVAVAEALGAALVTTDSRLASASGVRCAVRLVTG
ncbi:MAG TPA: type II toxin-antitoxin system VapC family toxin [Egibacteraceae bacterium]|nr:type II toxin-antitoxin system VapC family toxin [Egibacteraceae bacterium]